MCKHRTSLKKNSAEKLFSHKSPANWKNFERGEIKKRICASRAHNSFSKKKKKIVFHGLFISKEMNAASIFTKKETVAWCSTYRLLNGC